MDRQVKKSDLVPVLNELRLMVDETLNGLNKEGITGPEIGQLKFKLETAMQDANNVLAGRAKFSSHEEMLKQAEVWFKQAESITTEELPAFIIALTQAYSHNAVSAVMATTAIMMGAKSAAGAERKEFEQPELNPGVMWELVHRLLPDKTVGPMRLMIMDQLLLKENYDDVFKIEQWQVDWLIERAKAAKADLLSFFEMNKDKFAGPQLESYQQNLTHLDMIISGAMPGFVIVPNPINKTTEEIAAALKENITPPESTTPPPDAPSA